MFNRNVKLAVNLLNADFGLETRRTTGFCGFIDKYFN